MNRVAFEMSGFEERWAHITAQLGWNQWWSLCLRVTRTVGTPVARGMQLGERLEAN